MSSSSELVARRGSVVRHSLPTPAPLYPELPTADGVWRHDAPTGPWHDGYADGFSAGRQDALQAADEGLVRLDQLAGALAAAVADVRARQTQAVGVTAMELAEAAVTIAEAVVASVVPLRGETAVAVARALALVPAEAPAVIHVNPEDVDFVPTDLLGPGAEVIADPAVVPGGCSVFVGETVIDGGLASAMERVRAALTGDGSEW